MAPPRGIHALALAALALSAPGCAHRAPLACADGATARVVDTLYFGRDTPDGPVDDAQWAAFLDAEVTPRFPDGLTVTRGDGQWRMADGRIVREGSAVLTLVHDGTPSQRAAIAALTAAYKQRFRQEAVMQVRSTACVAF